MFFTIYNTIVYLQIDYMPQWKILHDAFIALKVIEDELPGYGSSANYCALCCVIEDELQVIFRHMFGGVCLVFNKRNCFFLLIKYIFSILSMLHKEEKLATQKS